MKAIILAAGMGTRMRPLTDQLPKPLLSVGGKPLIVWHLERLQRNGFKEVVINIAWLGHMIPALLGDGERFGLSIHYSDEQAESALETAGGIVKTLSFFDNEPFLVLSADIWCDYEYLPISPIQNGDLGHLILVDNPQHHPEGDFSLSAGRVSSGGVPKKTYSGISYFHPELFKSLSYGKRALAPVMREAMARQQISGEHHSGQWWDIGTPERLALLDAQLLAKSSS